MEKLTAQRKKFTRKPIKRERNLDRNQWQCGYTDVKLQKIYNKCKIKWRK